MFGGCLPVARKTEIFPINHKGDFMDKEEKMRTGWTRYKGSSD
ncbi:hypothetical protein [Mesobacillus maritimus]|nr:hypothetical protein [Mesobacillus maritimus]